MSYKEELSEFLDTFKNTTALSGILSKQTPEKKDAMVFALISQGSIQFLDSALTPDEITQYQEKSSDYYSDKNKDHHDFLALHELNSQFYLNGFKKPEPSYPIHIIDNAVLDGYTLPDFQPILYSNLNQRKPQIATDLATNYPAPPRFVSSEETVKYSKMAEDVVANMLILREKNKSVISTVENKPK